ncbi:hypothetical protein MYU51_000763 [Penicillium brevicompactum]
MIIPATDVGLEAGQAGSDVCSVRKEGKSCSVSLGRDRQKIPIAATSRFSTASQSLRLSSRVTRSRSSSSTAQIRTSTTSLESSLRWQKRVIPNHSRSASESLLRDTIPPNLIVLLVGVNPGIMTGTTGYAYAHPSNLFWKLLHSSGITNVRHPPSDTYRLPKLYSVGNANLVDRPTRDAGMLSRAEMDAGVLVLETKLKSQRPEVVCFVGKSIWEAVWRVRHGRTISKQEFRYGWQDHSENMGRMRGSDWCGARVFVATTTSGLAAGMTKAQKEAVWAELGTWVAQRRAGKVTAGCP